MMKTMDKIVVVVAVAVLLLHGGEAALYTVGDDLGWTIPPGGAATYAEWAAEHSFVVDDVLEFDFEVGEQDLALVTKEDYDSCNTADPVAVFQEAVSLEFLSSDTFYFTSTFAGHCSKGQKLAVYFASPAPTPAPSPMPVPCPGPCPAGADAALSSSPKFVAHKIAKGY